MAKGSHKTYGGWEQKTCDRCGGRLTLQGPACIWGIVPASGKTYAHHLGPCPELLKGEGPT